MHQYYMGDLRESIHGNDDRLAKQNSLAWDEIHLANQLRDLCVKGKKRCSENGGDKDCKYKNCLVQAYLIARSIREAVEEAALANVANRTGSQQNLVVGIFAPELLGYGGGQYASDAKCGFGLRCGGWIQLMKDAISTQRAGWSKHSGMDCFKFRQMKVNEERIIGNHTWLGIFGPDNESTLEPDIVLDPWKTGGISLFPPTPSTADDFEDF